MNDLEQMKMLRESIKGIEEAKPKQEYLYAFGIIFSAAAKRGGRVNAPKMYKAPLNRIIDVLRGDDDDTWASTNRFADILDDLLVYGDGSEKSYIEDVVTNPGTSVQLDDGGENYDLNFSTDMSVAKNGFDRGEYASDNADNDGFDRSRMHR